MLSTNTHPDRDFLEIMTYFVKSYYQLFSAGFHYPLQ